METNISNLGQYLVPGLDQVIYIPNFVTESEAEEMWNHVYSAPKQKWVQLSNRRLQNWGGLPSTKGMLQEPLPGWLEQLTNKIGSLKVFGSDKDIVMPNHVLINEYLPGQGILPHEDGPLYSPTIATLNLGSHTILNFYTSVSQIDTNHSFSQSEANGDYELSQEITKQGESLRKEARSKPFCSLFLERNSLVIISGTLYKALHGIDEGMPYDIVPSSFSETASPGSNISNLNFCGVQPPLDTPLKRSTRVSLTIRHVLKTKRIKGLSFLKPPR
eukprot:gene1637-4771_t